MTRTFKTFILLCLLLLGAIGGAGAQTYVQDGFLGRTPGATLESAVTSGSTGATWAKRTGQTSGSAVISGGFRVRNAGGGTNEVIYLASGTPPTAQYDTYFDLRVQDAFAPILDIYALDVRVSPNSSPDNRYDLAFNSNSAGSLAIRRQVNGVGADVITTTQAAVGINPSTSLSYRVKCTLRDNTPAAGQTTITWAVAPYPGTIFTQIGSYVDTAPITAAGQAGIDFARIAQANDTYGPQIEQVQLLAVGQTPAAMRIIPSQTILVTSSSLAGALTPNAWSVQQLASSAFEAVVRPRGAEVDFNFTGGNLGIGVDTSYYSSLPAANYPVIACTVDGGPEQDYQLTAGQTTQPVTVLASGSHTFHLTYREVGGTVPSGLDGWTSVGAGKADGPTSTLRLTGFTVDSAGGITPATLPSGYLLVLGDSISEDDFSNAAPITGTSLTGDTRTCYAYNLGATFGLREIRLGYAGTGYLKTSADAVPGVGTYFNSYDDSHTRSWTAIASNVQMVIINHGTNDSSSSDAAVQAAAQSLYADVLAKLPAAQIYVMVPFGRTKSAAITAAVSAAASSRIHLIDLGAASSTGLTGTASYQSSDGTHPNTITHFRLGQLLIQAIQQSRATGGGTKRRLQ